ncbi:hypothetical protein ACF0H5_021336 [Mactra antiquata]
MATGGRDEAQMSEETFDNICTGCDKENKTVEAVKYCVECKVYCCQPCTDMHKRFPLMADHSFLAIGQGNQPGHQAPSLPEFPTERCCIHKGKVLDMYCRTHDQVGCYACIAKDHKSCPESQIFSVPDMLDKLFNLSDCQQTQSRLQQMMMSMTTLSESKGILLESLKVAKNEAAEQIEIFQNVLERILTKAAESSRKELEEAYKKLEADILQDKRIIDSTKDELKNKDDSLQKASGNRAQRFVCSKEAEKSIKTAEHERMKQDNNDNTDVEISFLPNNTLMNYIQGVHGIGDVLVEKKRRRDLYKLKGSRDFNIKVSDDTRNCHSFGCCLTDDDHLLFTDFNNKKIKCVNLETLTVVDYCSIDSYPRGICNINQQEVAVACNNPNKIQFVSVQNKMLPTRKIDTSHSCYGIGMQDDKLYVSDLNTSLYVYDIKGTLLKTITNDKDGNKLFYKIRHIVLNDSGNKMFIGNRTKGLLCLDGKDNYLSTIKDNDLNDVIGVCTDGRGNIFVGGRSSDKVVQYNEDGKKIGVVVKQEDGLKYPISITFHRRLSRMFVTMEGSDVVKMYELE